MITWKDEGYGSACVAQIGKGLAIRVIPDGVATRNGPPVKFRVEVFEATLVPRYVDRNEAKAMAERAAKHFLTTALKALDTE